MDMGIPTYVSHCYGLNVDNRFQAIHERIEGILVLIKATERFEDRAHLLLDLRTLLDEADQLLQQNPKASKAAELSAD
jgi:hypothetical protein